MKTSSRRFISIKAGTRTLAAALVFSCAVVALSSAISLPTHPPKFPTSQNNAAPQREWTRERASIAAPATQRNRTLTFADRVAYQRAIEDVYWQHRIWPKENAGPKPPLGKVMSQAQIDKKVEDYLRNSQALEDYWQRLITPDQLQAEMKRIASHTKQPEVLRELFTALGNDPFVIAECLARPVLAERLLTELYAHDQRFHGDLKQRIATDLRAHQLVAQMKQTSGQYSEMELVRSRGSQEEGNRGAERSVKLNSREWDENVQKLAAIFGAAKGGKARPSGALTMEIRTGLLSPLQEDDVRYYATAILKKSKDRLKLATVSWRKEPLESWRARAESQMPTVIAAASTNYTLPTVSTATTVCTDDTWRATYNSPDVRAHHTAVWTGTEMIVWGGDDSYFLNTGGRYNPSTDSWTATSITNAPDGRRNHTAVWTGTEMIVWGGEGNVGLLDVNTGGRYNPSTDSWTATSTTSAPAARELHTAVWTGSEMIVWGGFDANNNSHPITGGRYNPSTDSWTATSTTNAPTGRYYHTVVWTGSQMIVWGGYYYDGIDHYLNTGGRYNPTTDTWVATTTTNVPTGRFQHTAVWTGSEMIIWGGFTNTGGRYNPSTDTWVATTTSNAPDGRESPTAVWTGTEMIVWGGYISSTNFNTGGRYNPNTDSWTATSTANAPDSREYHTAVWTGTQMIVWGGGANCYTGCFYSNTGGRYNPTTDTWMATSVSQSSVSNHAAVWTGTEMVVWGGFATYSGPTNTGGRYNPSTDSWTATSTTNAPSARENHTAVWTGSQMIVWGGFGNQSNTGGRYNPSTDSWTATSTISAPAGRGYHTAVWTGSEMIVWGGAFNNAFNTGGRYNPNTDSWTATSTTNAPSARYTHTAVWTGSQMIVWGGGANCNPSCVYFNTGGRYNPSTDSWTATSTTNAPSARAGHTAVWTGSQMIVWGGGDNNNLVNTGGRYNPNTDSWTATSITNAPSARANHTAVWTGSQMIVWGGGYFNTGGRYNPNTDSWTATSTTNAPGGRAQFTAVWTGSEMIVWGGADVNRVINTGGRYCVQVSVPVVTSAVSRKTHGGAGNFDIAMPLTGSSGVECRSTGGTNDYTLVVSFSGNVTVTGSPQAQVTSGTGCVGSAGMCMGNVSVNGAVVTVPLTNIANAQVINVRINGVNSANDQPAADVNIPMGILWGDTNGNRAVNAADVAQAKGHLGQTVDATNFRADVNANGAINGSDVSIVKSNLGTGLP